MSLNDVLSGPCASEFYQLVAKAVALFQEDRINSPSRGILELRQRGHHDELRRDVHLVVSGALDLRLVSKHAAVVAAGVIIGEAEEVELILAKPLHQRVGIGKQPASPRQLKDNAA